MTKTNRFVPFSILPVSKVIEIGTPQTGVIRLPQKGSLTVAEDKEFGEFVSSQEDGFSIVATTANRIAQQEGTTAVAAYKALIGEDTDSESALAIRLKYSSDLMAMNRSLERSAWQRKVFGATLILRRSQEFVSPGAEFPGMLPLTVAQADEMRNYLAEWGGEQTLQLPHALIDLLWHFFESEQAGAAASSDAESKSSSAKPDKELEKELGKPELPENEM